jgi:hypothetical protein
MKMKIVYIDPNHFSKLFIQVYFLTCIQTHIPIVYQRFDSNLPWYNIDTHSKQ